METFKLGEMELRFAELIWANAPISSRALCELCNQEFAWKRTTTYTMLKRLCLRKIFDNQNGVVIILISREAFKTAQGKQFLIESFNGSLPQFINAFTRHNKLSDEDIYELQRLINEHKEG